MKNKEKAEIVNKSITGEDFPVLCMQIRIHHVSSKVP